MSIPGFGYLPKRMSQCLLVAFAVIAGMRGNMLRAESPYPIVLVHGIASSAAVWDNEGVVLHLRSLGMTEGGTFKFVLGQNDTLDDVTSNEEVVDPYGDIWRVDFHDEQISHSDRAAVFLQAKALQLAIRRIAELTGKDKVILVGHSMGGLAAGAYLVYGDPRVANKTFHQENLDLARPVSVAKMVTMGTPFGGATLASLLRILDTPVTVFVNAIRDLTKDFQNHQNVLLIGGFEDQVAKEFFSRDVNCDGSEDGWLKGLNNMEAGADWPIDIGYFWIVGTRGLFGDCIVEVDDQYLDFAPAKFIHASHTCGVPCYAFCCEMEAHDVLVEALDEPDGWASAWELTETRWTEGFLTRYDVAGTDADYFFFEMEGPTFARVNFINQAVTSAMLTILDEAGVPISADYVVPAAGELEINIPIEGDTAVKRIIEVSGSAQPADPDNPCDATCATCRDPYRLQVLDRGASQLSMTAEPQTVGTGQVVTLGATVVASDGTTPVPGAAVVFATDYPGDFGACEARAECAAVTDNDGRATVTFTSPVVGMGQFSARTGTGGSDAVVVTFAEGDLLASAAPNPVATSQTTTISVTVVEGDGTPPSAGTAVTFSTSHPGTFSGNGANSNQSPATVLTDADGHTWIYFASTVVGTAFVTVESLEASAVVPVAFFNPNGNLTVDLSVGFVAGTENNATFEIEALVRNVNGQPVPGERVDFTTTRGSLSAGHDFTGPSGIADTNLTVLSSGDVSVTGSAGGITAATTFHAQVGEDPDLPLAVDRSFSFSDEVLGVAYTPAGGAILIAGDFDGNIKAWNTADWSQRWTNTTSNDKAAQISISSDGSRVLRVQSDGVDVFNVSTGAHICQVDNSDTQGANAAFISNSSYFETSFDDLYLHSSLCGSGVREYTLPSNHAFQRRGHLDFNSAKNWVAATTDEGALFVWHTNGSLVRQLQVAASQNAYDTDFSLTGSRLLVAGGVNGILKSYDTTTWSATSYTVQHIGGTAYGAAYIDNDQKIAVGGVNKVEILSALNGASTRVGDISGNAYEMAWSQDREELAVGSSSGVLYIFKPLAPIDTQAPVLSITSPQEGQQTNDAGTITTGRVTDNTQVASFTIDGVAVPLDAEGFFNQALALTEGANTITYEATDPAGNTSNQTRHITLFVDHTPPAIVNVQMAPPAGQVGQVFQLQADVVDGDSGVASVIATVRDSGGQPVGLPIAMTPGAGTTYSVAITTGGFGVGFYRVDVEAVDTSPQANARLLEAAAGFEIEAPPTLSLSALQLDFGSVMYGSSATRNLTVTNAGGGVLSGMASTSAPFAIESGGTYALERGQSALLTASFDVMTIGEATGDLVLTGGGGAVVMLKGTVIAPPDLLVSTEPPTGVPLGLGPMVLEARLMWGLPPITLQWTIASGPNMGYTFPANQNPIVLDAPHPVPAETTDYRVEVTDQRDTLVRLVRVLVPQNPQYRDYNGDGANSLRDLWALIQLWGMVFPDHDDPNADGILNVQDFLYINTGDDLMPVR